MQQPRDQCMCFISTTHTQKKRSMDTSIKYPRSSHINRPSSSSSSSYKTQRVLPRSCSGGMISLENSKREVCAHLGRTSVRLRSRTSASDRATYCGRESNKSARPSERPFDYRRGWLAGVLGVWPHVTYHMFVCACVCVRFEVRHMRMVCDARANCSATPDIGRFFELITSESPTIQSSWSDVRVCVSASVDDGKRFLIFVEINIIICYDSPANSAPTSPRTERRAWLRTQVSDVVI